MGGLADGTAIKIREYEKRIAELEDRAIAVIETLRGSGGINPEAAKAINELAALLREEK